METGNLDLPLQPPAAFLGGARLTFGHAELVLFAEGEDAGFGSLDPTTSGLDESEEHAVG
jgi:hypothetical protein